MAWIERSMPPSMMTKVTPVARMNSIAVSPASCRSVSPAAGTAGCDAPTMAHQDDQRQRAAAIAAAVSSRGWRPGRSSPQTMCPIRSTCSRLVAGRGVGAVGDHAVAHDQDGVAEADRLLQRVGGQDDGDALGGHGADQLVDLLLGADVEAAGRDGRGSGSSSRAFSHLASTTFCWLPPERLRHSVSMPGVRMRSRSTQLAGQPPLRAGVDQAVAASARRGSPA